MSAKALAEAVKSRRADLSWKQTDIADRARLSLDRIQAIEAARFDTYRRGTLEKLDAALGWKSGSAANVLGGGAVLGVEPIPEPDVYYRVEVLASPQATPQSFTAAEPTWQVAPSGELDIVSLDGPVATFAAGCWSSVCRLQVTDE